MGYPDSQNDPTCVKHFLILKEQREISAPRLHFND
jgi:hypothetical protein